MSSVPWRRAPERSPAQTSILTLTSFVLLSKSLNELNTNNQRELLLLVGNEMKHCNRRISVEVENRYGVHAASPFRITVSSSPPQPSNFPVKNCCGHAG